MSWLEKGREVVAKPGRGDNRCRDYSQENFDKLEKLEKVYVCHSKRIEEKKR